MSFEDGSAEAVGAHFSLFDVEDQSAMPKVRDMIVAPVSPSDVDEFARRYHYTETGGNMTWRWGLWNGVVLHGVVAYNLPTRTVCQSVFGPEHGVNRVWHMGRLILSEDSPRNSESRLIGGSLRAIERNYPDVWAVVTYAATDVGHIGTVYQATNAIYTGEGGDANYYVDSMGKRRGTHLGGRHVDLERAASMGWTHHVGGTKHRYLYILGNKTQRKQRMKLLRYPILPYPKQSQTDRKHQIGGDAAACKQTTSPPPSSNHEGTAANEEDYSPQDANGSASTQVRMSTLRRRRQCGGALEEVAEESSRPQQSRARSLRDGYRHVGP